MEKIKLSFLGLLFILSISTSQAETNLYNVEIVIFEDRSNHYINSEQWPVIHPLEQIQATDKTIPVTDIFSDIEAASVVEAIQAEQPGNNSVINITHNESYALADYVIKLNNSSKYNVLLHQSWQQTGLSNEDAVNIQIDSSEIKNSKNNKLPILSYEKQTTKLNSNIQGSIKIILGRYLHIHTDLLYMRLKSTYRSTSPVLNGKAFDEFEIKSQRRMRSNELHYLDHPLLGILVIVSPIKK